MNALKLFSLTTLLTLMSTTAQAEAPYIVYASRGSGDIEQQDCLRRGAGALESAGFGNLSPSTSRNAIYARTESYRAVIMCMTDRNVIVVTVAGPNNDEAIVLRDAITEKF